MCLNAYLNNIINTTIANNTSSSTWVMTFGNIDASSKIDNSIIYNNGGTSLLSFSGTNTLTASNSIIEGGHLSTQNVDPKFNNASAQDYSLDTTSPAIDTGNNSYLPASITKDVVGNDRVFNTTVDMGAYEFGAPLGIADFFNNNLQFSIYPNPTQNILNVRLSETFEQAEIYNLMGKKVLESTTRNINVSHLSNGIYFIKVKDTNGGIATKRFIKQ